MVLFSVMSNVTWPGPSIMFRPASPKVAELPAGQLTLGSQKAAVLNHLRAVGLLNVADCPGTTSARNEPLTPRLMSSPPPSTRGVKYIPEATVKSPLHCHPPRIWLHAPFCTKRWFSPRGKS